MEASLRPLLDEHFKSLEGSIDTSSADTIAPTIVDKILSSSEYSNLVTSLTEETKRLVSNVMTQQHSTANFNPSLNNLSEESARVASRNKTPANGYQNPFNESPFSSHSNTTYESSSNSLSSSGKDSQNSFNALFADEMRPGSREPISGSLPLQRITGNLTSRNSLDVRRAAIKKLDSVSTGDLLSSELWSETRIAIETAMMDQDVKIMMSGLRICARTFKASPPPMTAEVYLILVNHLTQIFQNGNFRLLHQFQMELPSCWLRFSEQVFKDVMNSTFRLFRGQKRASGSLSPLYCMSLIDTNALWFEKWMISSIGRAEAIASMVGADFISELTDHFFTYINTLSSESNASKAARPTDEVVVMDVDANDEDADLSKIVAREDLDYIHFLHVLVIMTRLPLFLAGRECFPLKINPNSLYIYQHSLKKWSFGSTEADEDTLSLSGFIRILIKVMCSCANINLSVAQIDNYGGISDESLNLSRFICKTLKFMANDEKCQEFILKDEVINVLIQPVQALIKPESLSDVKVSDETLTNIAETLSNIAATDIGNKFLLRGEKNHRLMPLSLRKSNRSEILSAVSTFVRLALDGELVGKVSLQVIGVYIFFLRQIYRTCEGLSWMEGFSIHLLLAKRTDNTEWLKSAVSGNISVEDWKMISVDNLLNFAGTPKGVLLLQQSGAMDICVAHMFERYEKKMQVSSREKFGYGALVSQISTTKPGMQALYKSGLIRSFLIDMWAHLESDSPFGDPPPDPDNYTVRKTVGNIFKAFSSFPGLSSIVEAEIDTPETPNSFSHLIRKMVMVDRCRTSDPLLTFEESHQIGLRIYRLLTSSIDSALVLESMFSIKECLLRLQEECRRKLARDPRDDTFIIDENSLLRNYILVANTTLGGPSERILPQSDIPAILNKKQRSLSFSFISNIYSKIVELACSSAISEMLALSGWTSLQISGQKEFMASSSSAQGSRFEELGLNLVSQYLSRLQPSIGQSSIKRNLQDLLRKSKSLVLEQQPDSAKSKSSTQKPVLIADYELNSGFDWFASTIFAAFGCSSEPALQFLERISGLMPAMFLWPHRSVNFQKNANGRGGIPLIYSCSSHLVEAILGEELPPIFSAFTLSGCTPSQISQRWIRECFWNVLDFPEIINYLTLNIVCGVDYHIYICIALLKHLERPILAASREGNLITYLNEAGECNSDLSTFEAVNYLDFMRSLEEKYRETIFEEMQAQVQELTTGSNGHK
ncbi:hypothetical protein HDU97_003123 [Phlyctochytrium planicorne]|nr:hypothetical protein HDU97_003074 [Phlyctochytrium planicorne]KAJ3109694.1 hypothetical protein HDU97_003123 [Phlyctochytrium planicorne]